jgi:uncharacterized protein YjbI with pentapeptide repeats
MALEGEPRDQGIDPENKDKSLSASSSGGLVLPNTGIEILQDEEIDKLIVMLSRPTQALTADENLQSMAKRQEAVDKHLLRGGVETLMRFFERIRQLEGKQPIKIDLSMLQISGRLLSGLYLPGANLQRLIFTDSDITGSNLTGAKLNEAVASGAIMRGVIATGAHFTNAVLPDADLSGGRFIGCTFINTDMTDVIVDRDTNFAGSRFIGTYLGRVNLSVTNTTGAVFRGIRR